MIRTSYPVSPIQQIRSRFDLTTRRTRRALEQRRRTLLTETDRRKAVAEGDVYLLLRWREDVKRARETYDEFFDRYDALVGLLCLAAHQGIEPPMEDEYREARQWFVANYTQRVQRQIAPYLTANTEDRAPSLWGRRGCDAFQAMYLPSSIAAMLEQDNGNLIGRMMRTQEALGNWEQSLKREEQAVSVQFC